MAFTVYLVRHGQTESNLKGQNQGWADTPLTLTGRRTAIETGKRLAHVAFTKAYSSDTGRAQATARLILAQNELTSLKQPIPLVYFREQYYGFFENVPYEQLWAAVLHHEGYRSLDKFLNHHDFNQTKDSFKRADPLSLAEDQYEFWSRLDRGLTYLRDHCQDGDKVLVTSHAETIGCLVQHYRPDLITKREQMPENGAVTKLVFTPNNVEVVYYNHYRTDQTY